MYLPNPLANPVHQFRIKEFEQMVFALREARSSGFFLFGHRPSLALSKRRRFVDMVNPLRSIGEDQNAKRDRGCLTSRRHHQDGDFLTLDQRTSGERQGYK